MRPADKNIEKLIEEMNFSAAPELKQRILSDALKKQVKTTNKAAHIKPNIWRIIMRSSIVKLAAAAVIIIAVIAGISLFEKTSSVAWADVVKQLENHTKYKCRQRVVRSQGPQYPTMNIYHLNLQQRRQEVVDGTIHIIDMRGTDPITVELNPAQKKATITKLIGYGPASDPDIIDMVKKFDQESTERLGTKEQNGKILYGFRHKPNEYNDFTVWVDSNTKLPVEIELIHTQAGQTIYMDEFEFDFNLDPSAFSTDVPEGYEVKTIIEDYRPIEQKEITAEELRQGLDHTAYTVNKLPWMEKICTMQIVDPLGTRTKEYITAIQTNDGNLIIMVQGNYYDLERMVWLPKQRFVQIQNGAKLYEHPNGSIYAESFLESFAKLKPELFDIKSLSEERFTKMIVMPNGTVMGLASNKQMSNERLQELVESLTEIKEIGGSFDADAVTWSQVAKQLGIESHTKYKHRQRSLRDSRDGVNIYYLNLSQRRQEYGDGRVDIFDMRGNDAIILSLNPQDKKATITKLLGFGPKSDPDIFDMVRGFNLDSTERLGAKEKNGKILYGFRNRLNKYNEFTVWVDTDTKFPVEIELKHPKTELGEEETIYMDEFEFDFNLDLSAFSTEPPEGYKVETKIENSKN